MTSANVCLNVESTHESVYASEWAMSRLPVVLKFCELTLGSTRRNSNDLKIGVKAVDNVRTMSSAPTTMTRYRPRMAKALNAASDSPFSLHAPQTPPASYHSSGL